MAGFFSMDGYFYKIGTFLFDIIAVSILWGIFSGVIPILLLMSYGFFQSVLFFLIGLHVGPATTALYFVTSRMVRKETEYLWKDFWRSYRMNYKQGLLIWGILVIVMYVVWININNIDSLGQMGQFFLPFQFIILLESIFIGIYAFPLLARVHMRTKDILKNAFFIAHRHLLTTILSIVGIGLMAALVFLKLPFLIICFAGVCSLYMAYFIEKVLLKYLKDGEKPL